MSASGSPLSCVLSLPANFRREDILAFHRRDVQGIAEQVDALSLRKGIAWHGKPAQLEVRFEVDRATTRLLISGQPSPADLANFTALVHRLLGLAQPVERFEDAYRNHPHLGRLIAARPCLRVALCATPFEALTWAITAQQISLGAALSLRRRLIQAAGLRHESGLYCYPDAPTLAELGSPALHEAGFSQAKADTIIAVSQRVVQGALPLDAWTTGIPEEDIRTSLLAVKGIGPWTLNYTLLRGFGHLDGSLHGDVAVRRKLQILLGESKRLSETATRQWLSDFTPWRALVAAHLWAMPLAGPALQA